MSGLGDRELIELLKGVSRSFVLTIRALPKGLRRPVGLAYLLARASDTIADTATAPVEARLECLRAFAGTLVSCHGNSFGNDLFVPEGQPANSPGLQPGVTREERAKPRQGRQNIDATSFREPPLAGHGALPRLTELKPENEAERYLLANLGRIIAALEALPAADRVEIVALLCKITRGQESDLLRFPDAVKVRALETAADLDEYTYLVAGCVGEFWTRICGAHLPRYSRLDIEELSRLGRRFGQGLQLVNILRDLPEDIRSGRCYLPMAELRAAGVSDPEELRGNLRQAAPVFEAWRQKALACHGEARRYIEAVRPWRIRFACLLPWALGMRTLKLIGERSPLDHGERVKVGRTEVGRIMRRAAWAAASNGAVKKWALES